MANSIVNDTELKAEAHKSKINKNRPNLIQKGTLSSQQKKTKLRRDQLQLMIFAASMLKDDPTARFDTAMIIKRAFDTNLCY